MRQTGHALVSAIVAGIIVLALAVAVLGLATTDVKLARHSYDWDQAWYLAMSGLERCMAELRWNDIPWGAWDDLARTPRRCEGALAGGTYSGRVTRPANTVNIARAEFTGRKGRAVRRLVAILTWMPLGDPGVRFGLIAGGEYSFGGGSHLEGNIAAVRRITVRGTSRICGKLFSGGDIRLDGTPEFLAACGSTAHPNWPGITIPDWFTGLDYESWETREGDWSPYCPHPGDRRGGDPPPDPECDGTETPVRIYVKGRVEFTHGPVGTYWFQGDVHIVARDGFDLGNSIFSAPGSVLRLYTPHRGAGAATLNPASFEHLVLYAPYGTVSATSSGAGGTFRGVLVADVFDTSGGAWNFIADLGPGEGACGADCPAALRIQTLWEE